MIDQRELFTRGIKEAATVGVLVISLLLILISGILGVMELHRFIFVEVPEAHDFVPFQRCTKVERGVFICEVQVQERCYTLFFSQSDGFSGGSPCKNPDFP